MNVFDQMASAGSLLGVGIQIADVTLELRETLEQYRGDVEQAAGHRGLNQRWAEAEPETRSALLLNFAWNSREDDIEFGEGHAARYASDLHRYAAGYEEGSEAFHGVRFPAMPLPGHAGALASSLGFDRVHVEISLKTVLILMAPAYRLTDAA
ncbi:hypothetical protein ACFWDI_40405 [Streptomyces sp. NPDC060064]|uniref:hypothetical protein n=1 Tax=Streptomyces sp. NPDC060064 TaxID=3347049 RepID=UPI00368CA479